MSGVFWEPSQQPDLFESVTAFATSSAFLALALPMFALDLICSLVFYMGGMVGLVMTPVIDVLGQVGVTALSWSGLEESWSSLHSFLLLLVLANVLPILLGKSGAGSRQQTFSQLTQMAVGVTWLATFLSYQGFDTAAHNQVGLLALALQLGSLCVSGLFHELASYRHSPAPTPLDSISAGFLGCLSMEAMAAVIICAFGYPGLSASDDPSKYYCILPFLAMQCIYFTSVVKTEAAPDVTANGHVTDIKEGISAKIEEVQEVCAEKVTEIKEKIEAAVEKVADENPKAAANVEDRVEEIGHVVEDKVEEIVDAVKETVTAAEDKVEEKVEEVKVEEKDDEVKVEEKVEEVKADPIFQRLLALLASLCTAVTSKMMLVLQPVLNLTSAITAKLTTIPWACLTLHASTVASHLLHGAAWHHLTGSPLALVLPLITLLLPAGLDKLSPKLPVALPAYIQEVSGLVLALTTYTLVTQTGAATEEA